MILPNNFDIEHYILFGPPSECKGVGDVVGVLTLHVGGVAQTCHDDLVFELKEQLVVEEVDGERQEGEVKEEGRGRIKESAPWMVWRLL